MNKKTVILIIVLVACFLCAGCIGLGYWGFSTFSNSITEKTSVIKTTTLDYICAKGGDITDGDVSYFTDSFASAHTLDDAQTVFGTIFPEGTDCENLMPGDGKDFFGMLTKGQSVSVSTENGQDYVTFSFPSKDGKTTHTIEFVNVDGDWLVNSAI